MDRDSDYIKDLNEQLNNEYREKTILKQALNVRDSEIARYKHTVDYLKNKIKELEDAKN